MRKIIFAATIAAFALTVSACSESTEDAAGAAVDGAAADTEANVEAMGEAVEDTATDVGTAIEAGADATEAEFQDETVEEAAAD